MYWLVSLVICSRLLASPLDSCNCWSHLLCASKSTAPLKAYSRAAILLVEFPALHFPPAWNMVRRVAATKNTEMQSKGSCWCMCKMAFLARQVSRNWLIQWYTSCDCAVACCSCSCAIPECIHKLLVASCSSWSLLTIHCSGMGSCCGVSFGCCVVFVVVVSIWHASIIHWNKVAMTSGYLRLEFSTVLNSCLFWQLAATDRFMNSGAVALNSLRWIIHWKKRSVACLWKLGGRHLFLGLSIWKAVSTWVGSTMCFQLVMCSRRVMFLA